MATGDAQRILDAVDREATVHLAQELIRIPSFKTEETEAARFIADFLGQRGYEVQLQEVEAGRFQTIAILKGSGMGSSGGKSLMLNGHIDIDPLGLGWSHDPWTPWIDGDRLFGAGIRNMKGGVAAMIEAAEAVRRSGVRLRGDLVLACVVGELQGGVGTTYLCQHGPLADMAVVPEPFGADNVLTVHAGVVEMAVTPSGAPVTSAVWKTGSMLSTRCARPFRPSRECVSGIRLDPTCRVCRGSTWAPSSAAWGETMTSEGRTSWPISALLLWTCASCQV